MTTPTHKIEIVAEISGNHGGSLSNALLLVCAAKQAGADAVKLQYFDPEKLAARRSSNAAVLAAANGIDLLTLYRQTVTPREWFPKLFALANDVGIEIFSSVFDAEDVPFLVDTGCKRLKIASFEINDPHLIATCRDSGLSLVLSASLHTSLPSALLSASYANEKTATTLLHATRYDQDMLRLFDFERIERLRHQLTSKIPIGLSDHTVSLWKGEEAEKVVKAHTAMIEAHLSLPDVWSPDNKFSYRPNLFYEMVRNVRKSESRLNKHL